MRSNIFAIDLDGTLLNDDEVISDKNLQALNLIHEHGGIICIATGRSLDFIRELPIPKPYYIIANNGAISYYCSKMRRDQRECRIKFCERKRCRTNSQNFSQYSNDDYCYPLTINYLDIGIANLCINLYILNDYPKLSIVVDHERYILYDKESCRRNKLLFIPSQKNKCSFQDSDSEKLNFYISSQKINILKSKHEIDQGNVVDCQFKTSDHNQYDAILYELLKVPNINIIPTYPYIDVLFLDTHKSTTIKRLFDSDYIIAFGNDINDISLLTQCANEAFCPSNAAYRLKTDPHVTVSKFNNNESFFYEIIIEHFNTWF